MPGPWGSPCWAAQLPTGVSTQRPSPKQQASGLWIGLPPPTPPLPRPSTRSRERQLIVENRYGADVADDDLRFGRGEDATSRFPAAPAPAYINGTVTTVTTATQRIHLRHDCCPGTGIV